MEEQCLNVYCKKGWLSHESLSFGSLTGEFVIRIVHFECVAVFVRECTPALSHRMETVDKMGAGGLFSIIAEVFEAWRLDKQNLC